MFLLRQLRRASPQTLWSAAVNSYRIELWTNEGTHLRTLAGKREWFPTWIRAVSHTPDAPPTPVLVDVMPDDQGLLWILTTIASAKWATALGAEKDIMGNRVQRPGTMYMDTMIEVINVQRGRVVARRRVSDPWSGFAAPGILWRTWVDAEGSPQVELARILLVGR